MAESMIERVANVLATRRGSKAVWEEDIATARAAIEAMREPTDAMVRAMIWQVNAWQDEKDTDQDVWYAPIEAALSEETKP